MANTLRGMYGTDVLIATGNSFTGNVLKAGYTQKMAASMIMPNDLQVYSRKMSGAELKETVRSFVEGYQGGFIPFNRGSLPVASGISMEVREDKDGYTLIEITKNGKAIQDDDTFTVYDMKTADYRGILYNFNNEFWQRNKDAIPAISYAIDRQKMVDSVLLGEGIVAYGPLQRNKYNNEDVEKYSYDPAKAKEVLEVAGWTLGDDGIYERNGEKLSFTINVMEGDQVRADLAAIACQQLKEVGVDAKAQVQSEIDWANQEAFLIGWGSPFDADDHTYKVFGTDKGSNYSGYSNEQVDTYLTQARQTSDENERKEAYAKFQVALAEDPAYTFFCYCDVDYVTNKKIQGITKDTVLGHHGVGIFWNVEDWTIE